MHPILMRSQPFWELAVNGHPPSSPTLYMYVTLLDNDGEHVNWNWPLSLSKTIYKKRSIIAEIDQAAAVIEYLKTALSEVNFKHLAMGIVLSLLPSAHEIKYMRELLPVPVELRGTFRTGTFTGSAVELMKRVIFPPKQPKPKFLPGGYAQDAYLDFDVLVVEDSRTEHRDRLDFKFYAYRWVPDDNRFHPVYI